MSRTAPIRVVIVDDSAFMRKLIRSFLDSQEDFEVVGEAADGEQALLAAEKYRPDVMTMDYRMPSMDGAEAVRRILRLGGKLPRIVMVSAYTHEGTVATLECLRAGAVDYVAKPSGETSTDLIDVREEMLQKLRIAADAKVVPHPEPGGRFEPEEAPGRLPAGPKAVIVIGGSTGAPPVIENILMGLHLSNNVAIVVVQHMPAFFTATFASRLNDICAFPVRLAEDGPIHGGEALIVPGGAITTVKPYDMQDPVSVHVRPTGNEYDSPSINTVMSGLGLAFGDRCVGVILSGMGDDGSEGARVIRRNGGRVFVQSREEAVIDSMPERAKATGAVEAELPVIRIIRVLNDVIAQYAD